MKKKFDLKSFVCGVLVMALILTLAMPVAALTAKNITIYSGLKLYVDGEYFTPKDPNGKVVDVFAYDGTTYLPVRAISEALGKSVFWDSKTQSVYVGKTGLDNNFLTECPPYQLGDNTKIGAVTVAGQTTSSNGALYCTWSDTDALFNLDEKYNTISFTVGHIDNGSIYSGVLNIYLDDKLSFTSPVTSTEYPHSHTLSVQGAKQMRIEFAKAVTARINTSLSYAVYNITGN